MIRHALQSAGRALSGVLLIGVSLFGIGCGGGSSAGPTGRCEVDSENFIRFNDGQSGTVLATLGQAISVRVGCVDSGDGSNIWLGDRTVTWTVASGGGAVNGQPGVTVRTDSGGVSSVAWTLGATVGVQTVTAQVSDIGRRAEFTATATAPTGGGDCASAGGTDFGAGRVITADETWALAGSPYKAAGSVAVLGSAVLTIGPGVVVCVNQLQIGESARLDAQGSAAQPIRLSVVGPTQQTNLSLGGSTTAPASASVLRHVIGDNVGTLRVVDHPVRIEDSRFTIDPAVYGSAPCTDVRFEETGAIANLASSAIRRTVFNRYGGSDTARCPAGVYLEAPAANAAGPTPFEARVVNAPGIGLRILGVIGMPAWSLTHCEVSGSGVAGMVFEGTAPNVGATVAGCNIFGNNGLGINNTRSALYTVMAEGNWWGDPTGPSPPAGDGVSAGVNATNHLTAPVTLGY